MFWSFIHEFADDNFEELLPFLQSTMSQLACAPIIIAQNVSELYGSCVV